MAADPEAAQNPSYIIHLKATLFRPFGPGRRRFSGWISLDADVRLDFGISFSYHRCSGSFCPLKAGATSDAKHPLYRRGLCPLQGQALSACPQDGR